MHYGSTPYIYNGHTAIPTWTNKLNYGGLLSWLCMTDRSSHQDVWYYRLNWAKKPQQPAIWMIREFWSTAASPWHPTKASVLTRSSMLVIPYRHVKQTLSYSLRRYRCHSALSYSLSTACYMHFCFKHCNILVILVNWICCRSCPDLFTYAFLV